MGKHESPQKYPGRVSSSRFALNGCTPHSGAWRKLAQGTNFCSQRMRKTIASYAYPCLNGSASAPSGSASQKRHWYFPFRSGVNVSTIDFLMATLPADNASASDPRVRVQLYDVSGATYYPSGYFRHLEIDTGSSSTWDQLQWVVGSVDVPAEETFYIFFPELEDYARVQSITAWEQPPALADDTANGVCDPSAFEEFKQILDADIQNLLAAQTKIWQANAPILMGWTHEDDSSAVTVNSTTWTNIIDGNTSVSTTTAGCSLLTQYHDTRSGNVPCEIAAAATRTTGTGNLEIRFQSASGTLCSATYTPGGGTIWKVISTSFTANSAETKYDIQMRCSDGTTSFDVDAVTLWEYEA